MQELEPNRSTPIDQAEPLPFPFNQRTFCRYEPIEKRIEQARVLIVDDLLRDRRDLSAVAYQEWGRRTDSNLRRERKIAELALANIRNNIERLVQQPEIQIAHLSEVAAASAKFQPDAIVLSGTLTDFDLYSPALLAGFTNFIRATRTPVLGICGGHQLIGQSFGAHIITLDNQAQHENRLRRPFEYQYRLVLITDLDDPIFAGAKDPDSGLWQDYTRESRRLRVWQNHGLQLDRVPAGFKLLATAYFCRNQMMVKRTDGQLIYTVQFHLEKSFEDYDRTRATRWEHPNESRDGRIIFENFLQLALQHEQ
jgi:GMP synthase (glutamine-hydrolysing)